LTGAGASAGVAVSSGSSAQKPVQKGVSFFVEEGIFLIKF
jgi:hypothetical protein